MCQALLSCGPQVVSLPVGQLRGRPAGSAVVQAALPSSPASILSVHLRSPAGIQDVLPSSPAGPSVIPAVHPSGRARGFPSPGPRTTPLFGLIFCLGTSGSHPIERGYCLGSGFVLDFYVGCSLVSPGFELPVFVCSLPCASVWFPLSCDPVSPPLT